jgi:hypothetical protein
MRRVVIATPPLGRPPGRATFAQAGHIVREGGGSQRQAALGGSYAGSLIGALAGGWEGQAPLPREAPMNLCADASFPTL